MKIEKDESREQRVENRKDLAGIKTPAGAGAYQVTPLSELRMLKASVEKSD